MDKEFADAQILEYRRDGRDCSVIVNTWDDKRVDVRFSDAVGVSDVGIGDICRLVEIDRPTPFIDEVLSRVYDEQPAEHSYREYHFLDLDDQPCLKVVAAGVEFSYSDGR